MKKLIFWTALTILLVSKPVKTIADQNYLGVSKQNNISSKWQGYDLLKRICSCESNGDVNKEPRQFDENGKVIRGQTTPTDIGECQISLKYHQKEVNQLGLNVYIEADNVKYAKILFDREGSKPWNWSKGCWK